MSSDLPVQRTYQNDRLLRALRLEPNDRPPVWLMRQAGRYLPEYRALRAKAGKFMDLCQNPEFALEATLQPLRRFSLDAAILFSDILTIPEAWELGLHFAEGEGPIFDRPIGTPAQVAALPDPPIEEKLGYVFQATRLIRQELGDLIPLIGFAGSPWTLACYMIQGRSSTDFAKAKQFAWTHPESMHQLLTRLTDAVIQYLRLQYEAGADVLMVFDTWGGLCSHHDYHTYSLPYLHRIVAELKGLPVILFTKGGGVWLDALVQTGAAGLGLDWTVSLQDVAMRYGGQVALQGNLDPLLLQAPPEVLKTRVRELIRGVKPFAGHIMNLGHGIQPQVDPDQVQRLIETVHETAAEVR